MSHKPLGRFSWHELMTPDPDSARDFYSAITGWSTGTWDAGFSSTQLNKDLGLYREAVEAIGAADPVSPAVIDVWRHLEAHEPNADITRVYPFVRDSLQGPEED